jgi:hypothetical protein
MKAETEIETEEAREEREERERKEFIEAIRAARAAEERARETLTKKNNDADTAGTTTPGNGRSASGTVRVHHSDTIAYSDRFQDDYSLIANSLFLVSYNPQVLLWMSTSAAVVALVLTRTAPLE